MSDHKIPWTPSNDDIDDLFFGQDGNDPDTADSMPDMLCTMYAQQMEHLRHYASESTAPLMESMGDINDPAIQSKIREFAAYMVEELYEAINHLHNKPWKKTKVETDQGAFLEEVADAMHFFLEFLIFAGISPEQLFRAYFAKTLINIERQKTGY